MTKQDIILKVAFGHMDSDVYGDTIVLCGDTKRREKDKSRR